MMEPKARTQLTHVEDWLWDSRMTIHRMEKRLRRDSEDIPFEFVQAREAAAACLASLENLHSKIDSIFEMDELEAFRTPSAPLSDSEVAQLLKLNRRLVDITQHLRAVKDDVSPRLEAKLADPKDPMYDYEIEVRIDYQLREDDPAYAEDDDNYLTTRNDSLKLEFESDVEDWSNPHIQASLRAEPHCRLFNDLYDHAYGRESPRVPLRDCLRIGKVFVDVQIWQQYCFDVAGLNFAGKTLEAEELNFALTKMHWSPNQGNGDRSADRCFEDLSEQLAADALIMVDPKQMVHGVFAIWAILFSNGALLKGADLLEADRLKPMVTELACCWNMTANSVLVMSMRIRDHGFRYRETYFSLNALFVFWGLECVVNTWEGKSTLKNRDPDIFEMQYEALLEKRIDRWLLLSQWAGAWAQGSDTEFSKYLKRLTDLKTQLKQISDVKSAIDAIAATLDEWIQSFKAPARQYIENLNASSRESVQQYFGPLWIWNQLDLDRWGIAKIQLREFHRKKTKLLGTDVDHVVAIKLWNSKTTGKMAPDEVARTVNSIGNCCLLEKTFNISKSADSTYNFFCRVNEFRLGQISFVSLAKHFRLPGSLLRPVGQDRQRLGKLIALREQKIKAELIDYIDGRKSRVDY